MIRLKDQMNYPVVLEGPAKRIVSLVPSQTELLADLQLDEETVGITSYCIHPDAWIDKKTIVGGTKDANIGTIKDLKPDLIIANKEENPKELVNQLKTICPVYISDVVSVHDAIDMIKDISLLTDRQQYGVEIIDSIDEGFQTIGKLKGTVAYFIWKDPYMLVGQNNFINSIIEHIGLDNAVKEDRYIQMDIEEIKHLNPDFIFLSSEPYNFTKKDKDLFEKEFKSRVVLVDGEMFSWYGSRMVKMPSYFKQLNSKLTGSNK